MDFYKDQQFDSSNALKRKKNFSIYNISNKLFETGVFLQDLSKIDQTETTQNKVKITPNKRQIDEICPQPDGTVRDSRAFISRPSLPNSGSTKNRDSNLLSQKYAEMDLINSQSNLFESPGNRQKSGSNAH